MSGLDLYLDGLARRNRSRFREEAAWRLFLLGLALSNTGGYANRQHAGRNVLGNDGAGSGDRAGSD